MKFKLRHMEIFRAVMVTGSISGAARMLHTSQPGLSKTISYLEQTLGLVLFTRTKSALIPTKEARILYPEISDLYNAALQIDGLVDNLKNGQQEHLAIASSPSFALTLIPEAISAYTKRNNRIHISYRTITLAEISQEILGKKSEFVISTLPISHPNLVCEELFVGRVVCVMPKGHPLEACDAVDLKQIADYPTILYDRTTLFGKIIREALYEADIDVQPAIEVIRTEQACALAQAGLGLTLVSEFSIGRGIWTNVTVRPVKQDIPLPVTLIHSTFGNLSAQALEFSACLKTVAARSEYNHRTISN